jgi:hypothetical protein
MHEVQNHIDCEQMAQPPGTQTNTGDNHRHEDYKNIWVSEPDIQTSPGLLISPP